MKPILVSNKANNNEVLDLILKLYFKVPSIILDPTFNKGSFWRNLNVDIFPANTTFEPIEKHIVLASDLDTKLPEPVLGGIDARNLSLFNDRGMFLDAAVLDFPYAGTGGQGKAGKKKSASKCITGFGNDFLGSRSVDIILQTYYDGITEVFKYLKQNGILIVKIQDQIESGKQRYCHVDIINFCKTVVRNTHKLEDLDIFYVTAVKEPMMRHDYQLHGRKNISFFLLFKKVKMRIKK